MDKVKRIAAIIGVVLIASMYVISLISAFFATEKAPGLFLASVFSTIVIPIMIYLFIAVYKYVHKNDNLETSDNSTNSNVSGPKGRL
jgi:energy-coupling factor transporter transmembrane protein EcfT